MSDDADGDRSGFAPEADDPYRDWDAAYVLGALPADERLEYERHLATCDACRDAVAELAGLPGILGRLPVGDAVAVGAAGPTTDASHSPVTPLRDVAHLVRRRRRLRRTLLPAIAAVAVIIALVSGVAIGGAGAGTSTPAQNATASEPMHSVGGQSVLTANIRITKKPWGTRFDWSCSYRAGAWSPGSDTRYDLVVTRTNGATQTVATWTASGSHATDLAAATATAPGDIRTVAITLHGSTKPLVESHP